MIMKWNVIINSDVGGHTAYVPNKLYFDIFGLGSAIGGVAQAGASLYAANKNYQAQKETNAMNYKIAQESNQFNKDMYQQQFQDQIKMWNMQNEYNDPAAERARLLAAGYNPSMNLGNGGTASAMSAPAAPTAETPVMEAPQYSDIGASLGAAVLGAIQSYNGIQDGISKSIGNTYADAKAQSDLAAQEAATEEARSNTKVNSKQYDVLTEQLLSQRNANALFKATFHNQVRQYQLQNDLTDTQILAAKQAREESIQNVLSRQLADKLMVERHSPEMAVLRATVAKMTAETNRLNELTPTEKKLMLGNWMNQVSQAYGVKLDNDVKKRSIEALVEMNKANSSIAQRNARFSDQWINTYLNNVFGSMRDVTNKMFPTVSANVVL